MRTISSVGYLPAGRQGALFNKNGFLYVGMTGNIQARIKEHLLGNTRYTKNKKIVKVYKIEICCNIVEARSREKYWKAGYGKERLKKIIRTISSVG